MIRDAVIVAALLATGVLLLWPRLARAPLWRAAITPLASIIGSGFLVLGPILQKGYGWSAPAVMMLLCLGAWGFGAAIRANILRLERVGLDRTAFEDRVDLIADWALAFAYFVSVAYYLNLFGAFAVQLTPWPSHEMARIVTSAMFLLILGVGWTRGFSALERAEQVSVGIKLAVIAGLLAGLGWTFAGEIVADRFIIEMPELQGWAAVTLGFGLIVTVQGFETSRYLGHTYDAETRVRSMKLAQIIAAVIYMAYIVTLTYTVRVPEGALTETVIIAMMGQISPLLPGFLVLAALSAQFSAAIADTSGSGGLMQEVTRGRVSERASYGFLVAVGLLLTWVFNVFEIISYASRAFALYYSCEALIAARGFLAERRPRAALGAVALALLGLAIALFGAPVE